MIITKTCPDQNCTNYCTGFDNDDEYNYCPKCGQKLINFEDDESPEEEP